MRSAAIPVLDSSIQAFQWSCVCAWLSNAGSTYPQIIAVALAMTTKHTGNVNGESDDGR
jgi:hypothetical protein